MRKILPLLSIFTLTACLFLTSCADEQPAFIGKWKFTEMHFEDDVLYGAQLDNPTLLFNADGTYDIYVAGDNENGEWTFDKKENAIILNNLTAPEKEDQTLIITNVDEDNMTYETRNEITVKAVLVRVE